MKSEIKSIAVVIVAAIVLGVAIGTGSAAFRAKHTAPVGGAKVAVASDSFDFGEMDADKEGSHDFVFSNKGTGPLILSRGASTCRCTVGEIAKPTVAPGESTTVRITWKSKHYAGAFKQSVTINTNDTHRREVILTITGAFSEAVHLERDELDFGRLVDNEPVAREVRILCNLPNHTLKIIRHEFTDRDLAKFFEVQTRPLTADELEKEKRIGSCIVVTVTAKPGLPPGRFQQRILLHTNLPTVPEIDVPLFGSTGKDVSVAGNGWDDDIGVLNIGPVKAGKAVQRQLFLIARGADAKTIRYNVVHVEPDFLKVKLGETEATGNERLSRTKLTIEIPARNAPADYMDAATDGRLAGGKVGEIDIDTTSSEVHQVKMRVRFAVEGAK